VQRPQREGDAPRLVEAVREAPDRPGELRLGVEHRGPRRRLVAALGPPGAEREAERRVDRALVGVPAPVS
jgi:hypothetical protein